MSRVHVYEVERLEEVETHPAAIVLYPQGVGSWVERTIVAKRGVVVIDVASGTVEPMCSSPYCSGVHCYELEDLNPQGCDFFEVSSQCYEGK